MKIAGTLCALGLLGSGVATYGSERRPISNHRMTAPGDQPGAAQRAQNADNFVAKEQAAADRAFARTRPKGTVNARCDYQLGDFTATSRGFRFTGAAFLHNTSQAQATVRIVGRWFQTATGPIRVVKWVHLAPGMHRQVRFSTVVTQDQLSQIQSLPYDEECRITASFR